MGGADRMIRLFLTAFIAVLYFTNVLGGTLGIILLAVAGIFLVTSFVNFCPLYAALGLRTNRSR